MKILFVDDENYAVDHFLKPLRNKWNLKKVDSVGKARAEFDRKEFDFDVVVLDVQIRPAADEAMSDKEYQEAGINLYRRLRTIRPKQRIIILTNNPHRIPDDEVSQDPFVLCFDKSQIDPADLVAAIEEKQ